MIMDIRVLHLVHWLNRGGIETWLMNILRHFARTQREITIDVCCKGPSIGAMADEARMLGSNVLHCPAGARHMTFGRRFARILESGQYNIVHIHTGPFSGYPVRVCRRLGSIPVVTFHNVTFESQAGGIRQALEVGLRRIYTRFSVREACRHGAIVTGTSEAILTSIIKDFGVDLGPRAGVCNLGVPDPVSIDRSVVESLRESLGISANAKVVLNVGSLRTQKNQHSILLAATEITRQFPNVVILIAGEGPLRAQLRDAIDRKGLRNVVSLLGSRSDVPALLQLADLFLFPSRWEGLGLAVVEAQFSGVPVVASDIPALREAVIPDRTAILVPPGDVRAIEQAVCQLLGDAERRKAMGNEGAYFAKKHFSIESSADTLVQRYKSLLKGTH